MFRFPGTVRYVNECEKLEIHREGVKKLAGGKKLLIVRIRIIIFNSHEISAKNLQKLPE